jgi:phage terminase large subunit GpA-like protein
MQVDIRNPLTRGFFSQFKVPTRLTVTQWADEFRMLPSKGAAAPGKYRSSRTPYMVEPMDMLSVSSACEVVVIMAAAQTGKSESGNNWAGYVIDNAPGPMLLVQPTVDNAKRYSKQRIGPMIAETPTLAAKVIENKSREGGNTMLEKEFPNALDAGEVPVRRRNLELACRRRW